MLVAEEKSGAANLKTGKYLLKVHIRYGKGQNQAAVSEAMRSGSPREQAGSVQERTRAGSAVWIMP